ncbi:MAG: hypothetical protein ACI8YB_000691 [Patiriisocius sp.]|jgi:hypothetical protein
MSTEKTRRDQIAGLPVTRRRDFLVGTIGMAASSFLVASPSPSPSPSPVTAYELDLNDPATNLQAFVKLTGSLDSEPVYDIVRGSVYGLVAGQAAVPLFKTVGAGSSIYSCRSALEYRAQTRYIGMFLDWETEEPLDKWNNPYTGETCDVPVTRYGPGEVRILGDQILPVTVATQYAPSGKRPWFKLGSVVHMQREILSPASPMPLFPKADLMTYSGDWQQLADPNLKRIPSRLNFSAVETWREWMNMVSGEQPTGTLWWQVSGVKLDRPADYPAQLRQRLRREDPDFFVPGSIT